MSLDTKISATTAPQSSSSTHATPGVSTSPTPTCCFRPLPRTPNSITSGRVRSKATRRFCRTCRSCGISASIGGMAANTCSITTSWSAGPRVCRCAVSFKSCNSTSSTARTSCSASGHARICACSVTARWVFQTLFINAWRTQADVPWKGEINMIGRPGGGAPMPPSLPPSFKAPR